jgi:hypothetical protein
MEGSTRIGLYLPLACSASVIYSWFIRWTIAEVWASGYSHRLFTVHTRQSKYYASGYKRMQFAVFFTSPVLHCVQPTECIKLAYNPTELNLAKRGRFVFGSRWLLFISHSRCSNLTQQIEIDVWLHRFRPHTCDSYRLYRQLMVPYSSAMIKGIYTLIGHFA